MRALIITVAVVAAVGAAAIGFNRGGSAPPPTAAAPPATAQVTRQTLRETREADGQLGYGPASTVVNRLPGTITWVPESGATIKQGAALFKVDNKPVISMRGAMPAYRPLLVNAEGEDVRQLESNLQALGYKGFTVDEKFTPGTAGAVKRWQEDLGLEETGVVELGRVVFVDGDVRVDGLQTEAGQPAAPGQKVFTHTGVAKVVTVELDPDDQRMAKPGSAVKVTLPDGKTVDGSVTKVSTVIRTGERDKLDTKLEVVVALSASGEFDLASVDVIFIASERKDVLTVPVAALTAWGEGGFGLQIVEGSSVRFLPVKTGLFAGGRVEVSGEGLSEAMTVGVPR